MMAMIGGGYYKSFRGAVITKKAPPYSEDAFKSALRKEHSICSDDKVLVL